VVVIAAVVHPDGTRLFVAPVTHTPPERPADGVEIPANVKKQLGLDRDRSWIILTELNRFIWPGPDVRPAPGSESPFYDALPDWLFVRVRQGMLGHAEAGRLKVTKRTE
jgi:hypothetical protein